MSNDEPKLGIIFMLNAFFLLFSVLIDGSPIEISQDDVAPRSPKNRKYDSDINLPGNNETLYR